MILDELKKIKSGKNELRKFGLTLGVALGLLAALLVWLEKDYYYYFLILAVALIALGAVRPTLLKPLQKIWMTLALTMGWIMTRLILSILFYLVLTPMAMAAKLMGKDLLGLKFNLNADSYWITKPKTKPQKSDYERQF